MINVPEREEGAAVKGLYNKRNFEKIMEHLIADLEIIRLVDQNNEMLFRGRQ
jgi:hypothetical protein